MLILLIGFAGFSQTTTDPVQNSTAEVHDVTDMFAGDIVDTPVSVVKGEFSKDVKAVIVVTKVKHENRFEDLFAKADAAFDELYEAELGSLAIPPDLLKSLIPHTTLPDPENDTGTYNYRNPRDGIRC